MVVPRPHLSPAAWPPCQEAPTLDPATSRSACRSDPAGDRAASSEGRSAPRRVPHLPPTTSTRRATWVPRYQAELSSQRGRRYEIVTFVRSTRELCLAVTSCRRPCLDDPARPPRRRRKLSRVRC